MLSTSRPGHLLAVILFASSNGCGAPDWGDAETHAAIAALVASNIQAATVELGPCPRDPDPFPVDYLTELLERIRGLAPAASVGRVGPWSDLLTLRLDAATEGRYRIRFSTRESLPGTVIAILAVDELNGPFGFYEGDALWSWLAALPEVKALDETPGTNEVC